MINKKVLTELQEIVDGNLDLTMFPYAKGNSIRIGKIIIRSSKNGFLVYDCETNLQVARTFCKTAAVAVARNLAKKKGIDSINIVLDLDNTIQKHFNDCVFYKHTISKTTDDFKRNISKTRYEIAKDRTNQARQSLDHIIFS